MIAKKLIIHSGNNYLCPVCNKKGFVIRKIEKYKIRKCLECGLEFSSPMPSKQVLSRFYGKYEDIRAGDEVLRRNAFRNIQSLSKFGLTKNKRLLDFGCGKNVFVRTADTAYWCGYDSYSKCEREMMSDYLQSKWEFITMWGVLEHLVSPKDYLRKLARLLKPNGKIALTTVTVESEIPFRYKPPEHVTYWTKKAIALLFASAGFRVVEYRPYVMVQNSKIYLDCVLRTVPNKLKRKIKSRLPKFVVVPTNEIFVVGEKV